jgi:hypothetical protein
MADKLAVRLREWARENQERLGIDSDEDGRLHVRTECPLFVAEDTPKAAADLYIHTRGGKAHIFIEVERSSGSDTVKNIAKYWPWDERGLDSHKRDKIHLIQVRSPRLFKLTKNNLKSNIEIADFVAKKMEREIGSRFQFKPIDVFKDNERWEQEAFDKCKKEIAKICLREKASLSRRT